MNDAVIEKTSVAVVGGGIAGLYASYLLVECGYEVQLFEQNPDRVGGRIATRAYSSGDDILFLAEFGPMRFELDLQDRLRRLSSSLDLTFKKFSPTSAPEIVTEYEMTDEEDSFNSAAELHQWAVLKMFFGHERGVRTTLSDIVDDTPQKEVGPRQLAWLQTYMDRKLFVRRDRKGQITPRSDESIEKNLNKLRFTQTLLGDKRYPLLGELGLWNGLSEVITPGALAKVRDSGTFYHCIANNPSALEWGIFWLRQASVLGTLSTFDEQSAPNGTYSLAEKLRDLIEERGVKIHLGCEVQQVEPAKRPSEVVLRIRTTSPGSDDDYTYNQRTDHVVLALPQWPLCNLLEHFPVNVKEHIQSVEALRLLKAFIITIDPWWQPHLKAQSYAWRIPTRELHFFRQEEEHDSSDVCKCDRLDNRGMIMLYTDQPAIHYWDVLLSSEERSSLIWKERSADEAVKEVVDHPFGLLAMLIRRLLIIPHPGLAGTIEKHADAFRSALKRRDADLWKRLNANRKAALGVCEQIVLVAQDDDGAKNTIADVLKSKRLGPIIENLAPNWLESLDTALKYRTSGVIPLRDVTREAKNVRAYGLRDWSAEPFGGAAHLWKPKISAFVDDRDCLYAFSLRAGVDVKNVHICGEAYSGFQGFIEGALRTAEGVVGQMVGTDRVCEIVSELVPGNADDRWRTSRLMEIRRLWKIRMDRVGTIGRTASS